MEALLEFDSLETYDILLQRVGCQYAPHDASFASLWVGWHLKRAHGRLVTVNFVHGREILLGQMSLVIILSRFLDLTDAVEDGI